MKKSIILKFSLDELNLMLKGLRKLPYSESSELIKDLIIQYKDFLKKQKY